MASGSKSDVRKNLERARGRSSMRQLDERVEQARRAEWCVVIDEEVYVTPGNDLGHQNGVGRPNETYCFYHTRGFRVVAVSIRNDFPQLSRSDNTAAGYKTALK